MYEDDTNIYSTQELKRRLEKLKQFRRNRQVFGMDTNDVDPEIHYIQSIITTREMNTSPQISSYGNQSLDVISNLSYIEQYWDSIKETRRKDRQQEKEIKEPKVISKSKDYSEISIENLENIRIKVKEIKPKVNLDF